MAQTASLIHTNPTKPNTVTIVAFSIFHIGAIAALFNFSWINLWVSLAIYWLTISWGIGMGYHRLLTHRGYKCPQWFERLVTLLGASCLEGGPIFWVATHRIHHQKSDQAGDPHSPRDGAWWAHLGWMLVGPADHMDTKRMSKYAPDLAKDPFYVWLNDWHWLPLVVLSALLFAVGGWPFLLWGTVVRVTVGLHSTWLVNSATHLWGARRFATRDDSRNNWWVALLTFGEGWHNNHHAHPVSARHGLAWYEFDPSFLQIKLLEKLGIATAVRVARIDEELPVEKAA